MSKLHIDADIESTETLFEYSGEALQEPLRALHEHLLDEARKLQAQLPPGERAELPTMRGLVAKGPETEIKQRLRSVLADAFEAQLWANECTRTPTCVWRLNMSKLRWIYRQTQVVP